MRRQIVLLPTTTVLNEGDQDPNGSPYGGSPVKTLPEVWADESSTTYWYARPRPGFDSTRAAVCGWQAPPTLATFLKLTLSAVWDYAQEGGNNWYFPPDNAAGPTMKFLIRNRAKTGYLYSAAYELGDPGAGKIDSTANNCNTNQPACGVGYTGPITSTWEMTSHPEGGPWTLEDLIACNFAAGLNLAAFHPVFDAGRFNKVRFFKVRVTLDVEDLGGFVANVRHSASVSLRLFRRARNAITVVAPVHETKGDLFTRLYMAWPRGPSVEGGWGRRPLERRAGLILQQKILPESLKVTTECLDLRPYSCLAWAQYRIYDTWTPELNGLAFIDKGDGYTHSRAQDAWSPREGDGALVRVLDDYPNLSGEGLACAGAGDVTLANRNYDPTLSGWSAVGMTGGLTVTQTSAYVLVEELGYQSAALFTFVAAGKGARERSLGTLPRASGLVFHARIVVKNLSVDVPATKFMEWVLYRTGGGLGADEYWSAADRTWGTTPVYNPLPSAAPFGEVVSDAIPADCAGASSDPTYKVGVGRYSSTIAGCQFLAAVVDVQKGGASFGDSYGARPPLVVLDAPLTRTGDVHRVPHSSAQELWSFERGVAMAEFRPWWRAETIPAATVKPVLRAQHATDTYDAIQFVAGSTDVVRFERAVSGETTFQLDCALDRHVNRAHIVRVWARWLGEDAWGECWPRAVTVGYAIFDAATGELLHRDRADGTLPEFDPVTDRDHLDVGCDEGAGALDGSMRTWETRRDLLHEDEIVWRL